MVEFKRFMAIWFGVVILGTLLMGGTSIWLSSRDKSVEQTSTQESDENHFSVVYRGFIPTYSAAYPDYYITINDLKDNPLRMYIQLFLRNQEASGYYFMVDKYQTPPAGWTINAAFLGYIDVEGTMSYTYSNIYRDKPTSITEGERIETINLALKAYYDSSYTNFYSQDNFTVTYHLIDRMSAVWTVLDYDSFDAGTTEGWSGGSVSTDYYRSFRYSLRSSSYFSKSFSIGPPYSTAYLITPIRCYGDLSNIEIDGVIYFQPDVTWWVIAWYQFTIPLHYGDVSVRINIINGGYMDDVYVIAK